MLRIDFKSLFKCYDFIPIPGKYICLMILKLERFIKTWTHITGGVCNFIKKETLAQVFSYEFWGIFKNTFVTEHLWMTASR